jgi:hypothetical protein
MRKYFPGVILALLGYLISFAPLPVQAQEITFEFTIEYDGVPSQALQFGLREDALPGLDAHDVPEPPNVPDAAFFAFLSMAQPPAEFPNRWRYDLRSSESLMADRIEIWQFNFQADGTSNQATITIDTSGSIPVPYKLHLLGAGVNDEPLVLPTSITVDLAPTETIFFWELHLSDAIEVTPTSWGGIKSLYH